jgi:Urocanase Rossmann-like domain
MIDQARHCAEYRFSLRVLSFYTRIIPPDAEAPAKTDLGGNLLYAGALDDDCRALVAAANVAGAATLCATADGQAQKQAIRDGVIDFLVTTLDEALRILKNEIRKREAVAVCIGASPAVIEAQMFERGVDPDVLRPDDVPAGDAANGASIPADVALVSWSVSSAPARWMPKLDAFALQCAGELSEVARRWVQRSPRYLGRLAQSIHLALADRAFATRFMEGAMTLENASIPLKLQVSCRGGCEEFNSPNWNKDESIS